MITGTKNRQDHAVTTRQARSTESELPDEPAEGTSLPWRQTTTNVVDNGGESSSPAVRSITASRPFDVLRDFRVESHFPQNADTRQRRAKANALFDPDSLGLLERLSRVDKLSLDQVAELIESPVGWTKFGLLMQAYFVEILGAQVRITTEGKIAIEKLDEFVAAVATTAAE